MSRCIVWIYKAIIYPVFPNTCKFTPSCSEYMLQAIALHGGFRGAMLGVRRFFKCHPFTKGGIDPVPHSLKETLPCG
ncbi:MAG: membrane protein insertion efficiency factor YidD [Candidatus Raymondbacteria bacterium RifOxyC12_full_50_8]|uniref:Putative membrane protein insertion efficiency factor n=1 Tax=Candidatus Raymondbacteria bacterium RIFOXYD12_FULL_49_13 TaxID=1817890 RepID=A0A1F7FFX2_UNCRA|nr:MAG: membrane protein insertion efficiency factor YidD [Candidatus Raymondbacteria bacterium RIFOXYA2_FULL_49_16]OGK01046.1 MAG: membrane protein insertion efficiency factor YidD [Candidatus Raymondbacteria bacterium RifOxyB12_full_50_8]OGK03395.1 MAG: membrane protein insertion efficiency factor YidD [Candidatus Raymondbacteria bacterium RifOxyC12_full_50_8]OGK05397.1 MAG: membrane protein insertion efficiency factor YidD [Candidatus Raymondbacteria bacterium RIFOXYD12_FULL_49_13]OGP43010.1